jgi:hypothetical protein
MTQTMPAYFVGYFITIILFSMGWSIRDSLLLVSSPSSLVSLILNTDLTNYRLLLHTPPLSVIVSISVVLSGSDLNLAAVLLCFCLCVDIRQDS